MSVRSELRSQKRKPNPFDGTASAEAREPVYCRNPFQGFPVFKFSTRE